MGAGVSAHVPQPRAEAAAGVWAVGRPSDVQQGSRTLHGCAAVTMSPAQGRGSRELCDRAESRAQKAMTAACRRRDMPYHGPAGGLLE